MLDVDFETKAIGRRPFSYPPEPVGCAAAGKYYSWGHHDSKSQKPREQLIKLLSEHPHWCTHHGGFDVAVAAERLGVPIPKRVDDTLFLLFLLDPYGVHSLKPSAEKYLGIPPTSQDAVRQWLIDNKVVTKGDKGWAAHISDAPASVVLPYAISDIEMTRGLFDLLHPRVVEAGMGEAYEREVSLLPMLVDNEQQGVPIARRRLEKDLKVYEELLLESNKKIYRLLGGSFNIDSGNELADRLESAGFTLPYTAKGNRRTAREALEDAIPDGPLKGWLIYHSALGYSLKHFLRPWAEMMSGARESLIHFKWNQVKNYEDRGTVTGRLSSQPNAQNMTTGDKRQDLLEKLLLNIGRRFPPLPEIRSYVEAPRGMTLFGRDFSQQELKILADAEDSYMQTNFGRPGPLAQAYRDNAPPHKDGYTDIHALVKLWIKDKTSHDYPHKIVKNVNFGKIYGLGGPGLSANLKIPLNAAYEILAAHRAALPSIDQLADFFRKVGDAGEAVYTIGGRRYYAERPKAVINEDGDMVAGRSISYRLTNYYVQGSAADQTKEAMINWVGTMGDNTRFLLQVHDELVGMCPTREWKRETAKLDRAMVEAFELCVPQRTTGEYGKNWGLMEKSA